MLPPEIDLNEWLASNSKRIQLPLLVLIVSQSMGLEQIFQLAFVSLEPGLIMHVSPANKSQIGMLTGLNNGQFWSQSHRKVDWSCYV